MNHRSVKRIHRFSAWILIQALLLTPTLPAYATQNLRVEQTENKSGLEELRQKLGGLEEIATVEEAMGKFFGKKSGRADEIRLEQFLAERWAEQIRAAADTLQSATNAADRTSAESALQRAVARHEKQIDEFGQRVEEDRRKAGLLGKDRKIGPYRLPPLDPKEIPAAGQRSGSGDLAVDIPANRAYYELERLRLMAHAAIQRALGREIVVNIGIGFVGTAVTTATAAESRKDFGKIPSGQKKKLSYRSPLEGRQEAYYTIAYQRPSPASAYKVPAVNRGVSPIATKDATVGRKIGETTQKGLLTATFLSGSVAVADTIMLETELHAAKVLPTHLEHAQIHDEATIRLIRQVGQMMRPEALVIVESTIGPGFLRQKFLPAMNEELQKRNLLKKGQNANLAHAFQRLEPGPRWYQSLLEQERVGAGVTPEANQKLKAYFEAVGFKHRIMSRVEAVEFMKTLENAWRFGLLELMNSYTRAGEVFGVDTFEITRMIARARPSTHGLIDAIPSIQVGGYCVPKELIILMASMADNYGISAAEIMEIFNTRLGAAVASDFRGRLTPARIIEVLAEQGVRLDDARVHVMGVTYGAGVSDTRMSGVERAVRELAALGVRASQITLTDPYAGSWPELQQQQLTNPESWGYGQRNQVGLSSLEVQRTDDPYATLNPDQDVILLGTRHPQYVGKARAVELGQKEPGFDPVKMTARMMGREGKVLVDTFDFFSDADYKQLLALGWKIRALGKGHIADLEQSLTTQDRIAAAEALLGELRALRGQSGVEAGQLREAIAAVRARLRWLKSILAAESAKKQATRQSREKMARENQIRNEAAHLQQEIIYAQQRLAKARRWFDEDDPRIVRAQRAVRILQLRFSGRKKGEIVRLLEERKADVAGYVEMSVVRPALRKAAGVIKKSSFMHGVPARYLLMHRPVSASDEAQVDAVVKGPATRSQLFLLANYLDQAFHMIDYLALELLTPDEISQMLADIRHREESAHPDRALHPEAREVPYRVYGNDGRPLPETPVSVQMVHPVRWQTNLETGDLKVETDEDSWTNRVLKQLPDVRRADIPDTWGRYFVLVKPKLAPVKGAEMRAYPPGFDDLPPELAMWLARDVVGQGMMLTTLSSPGAVEQDKILLLMVVDPFGAGSGRAGYLVWADSLQPVVSVTPEGWEMPVSVKGVGLFVGGDERFPHTSVETLGTTTGRRVSGGMSKGGTVGQSTLAQAPGFVTGVGSEHGLTAMSVTDANYTGLSPRLVFGVNFTFTHGVPGPSGEPTEYFLSARQEPDTARMGWSFRGKPFDSENEVRRAAEVLGWNSAELLAHLPQPAIHIALSLDNVQANGYLTDPDSIVPPLYRERNPYGALFKYFGFSMQQTVMGWEQMKASREGTAFEVEDRNLALMKPWLRSFLRHLLESGKVRREPFEKFDRLSRASEKDFPGEVRRIYGQTSNREAFNALAIDLIDTLWNHYLAYEIFRNRLQFGYSHTVESTYTGTADERFDPSSADYARQYLASQRQMLEISRRLIEGGNYPGVPFDFGRALEEVGRHEQRLTQLEADHATDFREVYPLGFYRSEVKPVVAVLDLSAVQAGDRALHVAGEVPHGASIVEKEVVTAGSKASAGDKAGLEEAALFTLDQWGRIAENPSGSGLRGIVESYVPAPYVEKEMAKAIALIRTAQNRGLFLPDQPVVLVRTTGRARIFMGHPDLMGIGAFSIDAATHQSVWMLAQMTNDGRVIADNLQPEYGLLEEFGINDKDVLPENADSIAQARPDWLAWAQAHTFENRWEGLLKGTLAVIRTKMMDPTGQRRDDMNRKGLRFLLSESDIPSGKGFSASSSIPAGIGLALNALWEGQNATSLVLSREDLRKLDYAAYVVDDLAGVADITAILEGELGQATVLWYDPDRVGQKLSFPDGFRVFAFDSNIRRLNHTSYPPSVRNYGKNIQTLTNISVPLAILWLRMLAINHPKDLGFLEEVLTAHWPSGVMRELTEAPDAAIQDRKYAAQIVPAGQKPAVGYGAKQKRRAFVEQVMARVPNEWTLGNIVAALREGLPPAFYPQIDSLAQELVPLGANEVDAGTAVGQRRLQQMRNAAVIPMRQMAWYGIEEAERGLRYIAAAERGNTGAMLDMMREAHSGDRALYDPQEPFLAGTPRLSAWGLSNPPGAFQRSLVEIDRLVDRFQRDVDNQLGTGVAARVSGAGLGGLIMAAVDEKRAPGAYEAAVKWLKSRRPAHEVIEIAPSAGVRVVRLPRVAAAAGLEEGFEQVGLDFRTTQEVVLQGTAGNPVILLSNGAGIAAEGGGAQIRIAAGVILEQGVRIVAAQGQRIEIGEGTRILSGSQVAGNVRIGKSVMLDAVVTGDTIIGDGTQFTRGSRTVVHNAVLLPVLGGAKPVTVSVNQTASIRDSVVWGSSLFQGAKALGSLVGPFALMGNDSMASRSVLMGLSPDNRTSTAHHNDLISLFSIPLTTRRDLFDPAEREWLRDEMLALRFGKTESRAQNILVQEGHPSRPEETLQVNFVGRLIQVIARALNLGAHSTTSNFDPRNDGSKGPTLLWGGVAAGVDSIFSAPAEVGPGSLVSNGASVGGREAVAPGSLVLKEAGAEKPVKPGYLTETRGRLGDGVSDNVQIRLQTIRLLEVMASVAVAGTSRTSSEMEKIGYLREAKLIQGYVAENVADLQRYLAIVEVSEKNLAQDLAALQSGSDEKKKSKVEQRLAAQRDVLGQKGAILASVDETVQAAAAAVASAEKGTYPHRLADVITFQNPSRVVELTTGSPPFGPDRIEQGLQKIRDEKALFVIFRAGRASRFADSVKSGSQRYYDRAKELRRLDDQGSSSKLAAPLGVSGLGPDLRQLEALAELGRRAGRPVDVVIVDSAGNRAMLLQLMQADARSSNPRVAWEYLNLISEPGSHDGLVDQGEGLEVTTLDGQPVYEWNPGTDQRDKPVKVPSGEYGAFMAGVQAAQTAGIDVTKRDIVPIYGDQAGLYTDPDFSAALLGNMGDADVTGVAIQHRRDVDKWVPDGGVLTEAVWPDGQSAVIIAERDVRNPKLASQGIFNPRLDVQELETNGYLPYNAGAPVFSARFVSELLQAKVDLRKQVKTRQIKTGRNPEDVEQVQVLVSEMELTQMVQVASEQGRSVQVLRTELERRQALKFLQDVPAATRRIFEEGKSFLQAQLGNRLSGDLSFIEVSPGARGFQAAGNGQLTISPGVGVVIDRRGLWVHAYEGEDAGIQFFASQGKLLLPATAEGIIHLDQAVLAAAGLEEWAQTIDADRWAEATDPNQALIQSFSGIRATAGEPVSLPVIQPLPDTQLSPEHRLIFARYGYLFGLHQMKKFPDQQQFLFTLARDPRPSGRAVIEAQMRGIMVAARELGKAVEFRDGGILPTPFAEGLARMRHSGRASDGGVISTASHNPLIWNGVKYPTAAAEPNNALVQAGILLPAREMSGVVAEARQWMAAVTERPESADPFRAALNEVDLRDTVQTVDSDEVLNHMVQEARRMWGLTDPNDFDFFRQHAAAIRIVLDPNGGAATGHYRRFLGAFGFTVIEINNTVGQPHHGLEPINEEPGGLDHLRDAKLALAQHDADFAVVFDYDADRGNTLIRDRQTGEIIEPRPQEVAALNVAMSLAHRNLMRRVTKDTRPLAVVVHDATSRRIWEIARVYDAEVHVVEVGEVNVLEKMRDLERRGYDVAIGIEGANGGTVFRGLDPDFQGDTSRNGAMTALFTGLLMIQPQIGQEWLLATLRQRNATVPPAVIPSLLELVNALPGERGQGTWRFETPIVKQGKAGDVPEGLVGPFKQSLGALWYDHFWPVLRDQGIFLADGSRQIFSGFRIIHHAEAAESPAYGPGDPPDAGLTEYGQGGWTLELDTPEGNRAFLWFRGSLTEGLLRVSTEGQGERAAVVSQALLELFRLDQFPSVLASVKAGTQPILGRPLSADQRTLDTLPVSSRFRAALGSVMAEYGPGALGMAPDNYGDLVEYWMTLAPIKLAEWAGEEWVLFAPRNQIGQLGVAPTPARRELLAVIQEDKINLNAVVYALWGRIPDRQPIKETLRPRVEAFVENPHSRGLVQTGLEENAGNEDDTVDWEPEGILDQTTAGAKEVIPLNEDAAARTLVVLAPDTVLEGVERLLALRGASGQKVQVAVIVSDTQQGREVGELLAGVDLQLEFSSINLETEQLGVEDAILRIADWANQRGLQMQVVRTPDQFRDLGLLLVPVESQALWNAGMEEEKILAPSA